MRVLPHGARLHASLLGESVIVRALLLGVVAAMASRFGISPLPLTEQAPALPSVVTAQLSATYPGWRFARILTALLSELTSDAGERRSDEWITGDFNGDGRADYAVQIVRPARPDSVQLVVAFLATRGAYTASLVSAQSEHFGVWLRTARRGEDVRDYDRWANGDSTFVLRNDAIMFLINEGGGMTCEHRSRRWRCFQSAD